MIKPWPTVSSKPAGDFRIFSIRSDKKLSPRTGKESEFYVIDCVDWVNVIPITTDNRLVMIQQFRHGTETVELEVPGGIMDPTDSNAEATAIRELREETGYEGERARVIGEIFPNPAIMSNTCRTVLIENCELRHDTSFDEGEDLVTQLINLDQVPQLIGDQRIRHSLVVVALYHFELWRNGMNPK